MKRILTFAVLGLTSYSTLAQTMIPSPELQIKSAVLAAPADKRAGATVYGYTPKGMAVLRKGTNELICVADNPTEPGFSASCYHKDLQPFMTRGQELRKEGKKGQEIFDAREQEVKAGKLAMPKQPSTLFVFSAPEENYNVTTGEVKNGYLRYVVYIPYATAESTGLPLKPEGPAMPWIMHPGTHGAHIMINPPKPEANK
ncbi:hypothetical protein AAE02nite_41650 [Adhaeribacter aerolatus]|uniref:Uncharacterized protein n=1 Tax=Adhaeribacter aerolatus TaxID=670289 RepID=A0A512B3H0_9BACT|nr:hypothetical protein [Adhaeribacter aerolatus]GEO06501.1 hypothetical protein AAE02nite_41650 [Adhaeribacter aerolatus]